MNHSGPYAEEEATTTHRRYVVPSVADLADVRDSLQDWLSGSIDESTLADFLVIVSEVGSNAVEATPSRRPPAVLDARATDTEVRLSSTNHVDPPPDDDTRWDLDDPLRAGGRGMLLVAAYADDLRIEPDGDRVTVHCTVDLTSR